MHEHGVERLMALGTPSIPDPAGSKEFKVGLTATAVKKFAPDAYNTIVARQLPPQLKR